MLLNPQPLTIRVDLEENVGILVGEGQIYGAEVDPQFRGQPPAFLGDIARELVGAVLKERIVCRPPVDLAGFAFLGQNFRRKYLSAYYGDSYVRLFRHQFLKCCGCQSKPI